jgi:hypothetical protein
MSLCYKSENIEDAINILSMPEDSNLVLEIDIISFFVRILNFKTRDIIINKILKILELIHYDIENSNLIGLERSKMVNNYNLIISDILTMNEEFKILSYINSILEEFSKMENVDDKKENLDENKKSDCSFVQTVKRSFLATCSTLSFESLPNNYKDFFETLYQTRESFCSWISLFSSSFCYQILSSIIGPSLSSLSPLMITSLINFIYLICRTESIVKHVLLETSVKAGNQISDSIPSSLKGTRKGELNFDLLKHIKPIVNETHYKSLKRDLLKFHTNANFNTEKIIVSNLISKMDGKDLKLLRLNYAKSSSVYESLDGVDKFSNRNLAKLDRIIRSEEDLQEFFNLVSISSDIEVKETLDEVEQFIIDIIVKLFERQYLLRRAKDEERIRNSTADVYDDAITNTEILLGKIEMYLEQNGKYHLFERAKQEYQILIPKEYSTMLSGYLGGLIKIPFLRDRSGALIGKVLKKFGINEAKDIDDKLCLQVIIVLVGIILSTQNILHNFSAATKRVMQKNRSILGMNQLAGRMPAFRPIKFSPNLSGTILTLGLSGLLWSKEALDLMNDILE